MQFAGTTTTRTWLASSMEKKSSLCSALEIDQTELELGNLDQLDFLPFPLNIRKTNLLHEVDCSFLV